MRNSGENILTKLFIVLLFIVFFLFVYSSCFAEATHEEYKKIQKEIETHKKKLEKVKKKEHSVLSDIERLNKRLHDVEIELNKTKEKIKSTERKIRKVEDEINIYKNNVAKHREWLKRKLQAMFKYRYSPDIIRLIMHTDETSEISKYFRYLEYISLYEHKLLTNYNESLKILDRKEKQLKSLKEDLVKEKEKADVEEKELAENKRNKEMLLASIKKEEFTYKKMIKELKEASDRLLEIIKESERSKKEEKFILPEGKDILTYKGKLPWPVDGKVILPYGTQKDPQFNVTLFRSGTYIQANPDSYAKAVFSGEVVFAEWFKGYGQLVILNHGGGYHTLYGSLSEIFAKVGDHVKSQQVIGKVGNSGIVNSYGVYFEVRYKGKPLDPMQWLVKR
jgi:septal ring factor EnvC (AmiA/AmiB activator)